MAESPDGRGVLLFGGRRNIGEPIYPEKSILELRAGADCWTILNVSLESRRYSHVVIPLTSVPERRVIPPKYFENIFKTNDSVGVTRQQT